MIAMLVGLALASDCDLDAPTEQAFEVVAVNAADVFVLVELWPGAAEPAWTEAALSVLEELLVLTRASDDPLSRRYVWAALVIAGDIHLADGRLDRRWT